MRQLGTVGRAAEGESTRHEIGLWLALVGPGSLYLSLCRKIKEQLGGWLACPEEKQLHGTEKELGKALE